MTSITFSNGKAVMRGNAIATGTECCCGSPCQCPSVTLNLTLRVTLSRPYGICGVVEFDTPYDITYTDHVAPCDEAGNFYVDADVDITVCNPESYCGSFRAFFQIVGACDCNDTESCTLELTGWEGITCPDGIESIEII